MVFASLAIELHTVSVYRDAIPVGENNMTESCKMFFPDIFVLSALIAEIYGNIFMACFLFHIINIYGSAFQVKIFEKEINKKYDIFLYLK